MCCVYLNGPYEKKILLKTKTHADIFVWRKSQCLRRKICLISPMWHTNCIFHKIQFRLECYTVVTYQAPFRLAVYKNPAVYPSDAKFMCTACKILDFSFPNTSDIGNAKNNIYIYILVSIENKIVIVVHNHTICDNNGNMSCIRSHSILESKCCPSSISNGVCSICSPFGIPRSNTYTWVVTRII